VCLYQLIGRNDTTVVVVAVVAVVVVVVVVVVSVAAFNLMHIYAYNPYNEHINIK